MMLPRMPKRARARRPHLVEEDAICRHLSSIVLVSSAILASFYIPAVSFRYGNNALCKIPKVSNLASLDVI